ncbi:MAG: endonuclease/exonuclease/phosphatase family protein [Flavobacteriales bacterium]|nr:endonuclease/exonuclease/phosphatase family protein [Flavobacteriales bacterium]MBP9078994.1 endonuclease/exonuclease/phosphatase family protein [Flavobacteriales bacterium]
MPSTARLLPVVAALFHLSGAYAQSEEVRYAPRPIGFYNIENLFDTIDGPNDDAEFLPGSAKQWTSERYRHKLGNMARVIGEMGTDILPDGVVCLGLAEVENQDVLEDLVATPPLDKRGYRFVHHDSPDRRGVDVGFLYNPAYFTLLHNKAYTLRDPADSAFFTRDVLVVSGLMDGDTVSILVNHWPSRRGGEKRSLPKRILAAELGRHIVDSLLLRNADARILYMGDLNDDPVDPSVRKFLNTTGDKKLAVGRKLFNPMYDLYRKGIGTLAWRDSWNLFDQIILSPGLVTGHGGNLRYYGVRVFNPPYLQQREGNFAGYGLRTYVGDQYAGGFSDHFPVYVILVKEVK